MAVINLQKEDLSFFLWSVCFLIIYHMTSLLFKSFSYRKASNQHTCTPLNLRKVSFKKRKRTHTAFLNGMADFRSFDKHSAVNPRTLKDTWVFEQWKHWNQVEMVENNLYHNSSSTHSSPWCWMLTRMKKNYFTQTPGHSLATLPKTEWERLKKNTVIETNKVSQLMTLLTSDGP
jgi:hypothetical protein